MTRDECARLVNLIVSTWPAGVKGHVWTDVLTDLEYDLAKPAYLELRDDAVRPPPVAQFVAVYRQQRARLKPDDDMHEACALCQGSGWIGNDVEIGNPRSYSYVEPCRCSRGQAMRPVHQSILEHNRKP